jgi:hypothetical protein
MGKFVDLEGLQTFSGCGFEEGMEPGFTDVQVPALKKLGLEQLGSIPYGSIEFTAGEGCASEIHSRQIGPLQPGISDHGTSPRPFAPFGYVHIPEIAISYHGLGFDH